MLDQVKAIHQPEFQFRLALALPIIVCLLTVGINFYLLLWVESTRLMKVYELAMTIFIVAVTTYITTMRLLTRHNYHYWRMVQSHIEERLNELRKQTGKDKNEYLVEIQVGIRDVRDSSGSDSGPGGAQSVDERKYLM